MALQLSRPRMRSIELHSERSYEVGCFHSLHWRNEWFDELGHSYRLDIEWVNRRDQESAIELATHRHGTNERVFGGAMERGVVPADCDSVIPTVV